MLRFRVPGRGRQRPWNGLPVQAGCCPVSPRRYRSACHASQARSICAGWSWHRPGAAERAEVQVRPGQPPALSTTAGQHGRAGSSPAGGPGPGLRRRWRCGPARRRPGPGRGHVSGLGPIIAGLVRVLGDGRIRQKGPRTDWATRAQARAHACRSERAGAGRMPLWKRLWRHLSEHAGRQDLSGGLRRPGQSRRPRRAAWPSISSARSTSSTGWGRSVQPLALAMILAGSPVIPA